MPLSQKIKNIITISISLLLFILFHTEAGATTSMVTSGGASERDGIYSTPQAVTASEVGSASFSYPIEVPPGRNGLQPDISLKYSSYNGNGWLGVGWDLNMGSISRSNRYNLSYDSFTFVVDGADLVRNSDWGSNYYCAKIEGTFTKYEYISESEGWIAYAKDGTKYYYGSRSSDPNSNSQMTNSYGTFSWHLDKVEDTNGNYMTIDYTIDQGQIYPYRIYYTYHANLSGYSYVVEFELEDRDDNISSYKTYSLVTKAKRLKVITVNKSDGTGVYEYRLSYENSGPNGRSRLNQIRRVVPDAEEPYDETNSLPSYDITYNDGGDFTFGEISTQSLNGPTQIDDYQIRFMFGDINGDGRQDFIKYCWPNETGTVEVTIYPYLANSSGGFTAQTPQILGQYYYEYISVSLGDVDGDGDADLLYNDGLYFQAHVSLSNGDGTFSGKYTTSYANGTGSSPFLAELNGDGKADLVLTNGVHTYTYISTGDGYFGLENYVFLPMGSVDGGLKDSSIRLCDVNGDGRADIYVYKYYEVFVFPNYIPVSVIKIFPGNVYNTFSSTPIFETGGNFKLESSTVGDINGDGLADLAYVDPDKHLYVYLSNGTCMTQVSGRTVNNFARFVDIDDDGLADLLDFDTTGNNCFFYKSNGDGTFEPPEELVGGIAGELLSGITFADIDGDGKSDMIKFDSTTNDFSYSLANGADATDCIKSITNSLGGKTDITYRNSSGLPNNKIPFILHPIELIESYDGIPDDGGADIPDETSYEYSDAYYAYHERDFRGFGYVKQTNADGSTVETTYEQLDDYKKGRPLTQVMKEPGQSTPFKEIVNTWGTYPIPNTSAEFVKLTNKITTYEDNDDYVTEESYTYNDSNGFPEYIYKNGTDADGLSVEQITQFTGYDEFPSDSWTWQVTEETVTGATTGLARKVTYDYDDYGNMTDKIFWRTSSSYYPAIKYAHDSYGNVTSEWTYGYSDNTTIEYETDTYTYPWHITNCLNQVTTKTWDYKFGKEDLIIDPNGNKTDYAYDDFGRVINITNKDASDNVVGYSATDYTNYDQTTFPRYITTSTLESGNISTGSYIAKEEYFDGLNRTLKTITDGIDDLGSSTQIVSRTSYDNRGRKDVVYGPYFIGDEAGGDYYYEDTDYDSLGRVISVTSPDEDYETVSIDYLYPNPFTTKITDPDGKQKTEKRDHLGRIIEVIEHADAGNQTTTYGYNAAGDMTEVWNALGISTLITYDTRGLKLTMDDPDMGAWSYTYDDKGNLWTQTDAKGDIITFGYDCLNRIISKNYAISDPDDTESTPNVTYTYDLAVKGIGQLYSVTNSDVTTVYDEYDEMGRVKSVTKTIAGDQTRTTTTEYDLSGKVTYITHPDNFEVHNIYYPGTSLLDSVTGTESGGSEIEYAKCTGYKPTGKIKRIYHDYNGTETIYNYDNLSTRLMDLKTYAEATVENSEVGDPIQDRAYTYYMSGDIETITDYMEGITYTYTYDNLHRLLDETSTDSSSPTSAEVLIYTYDNEDKPNAVSSINYNGTPYDFYYDANGNMKSGPDFTNPGSVTTRTIKWNADNMPVNVSHSTKGNTDFIYDGDGLRAKKVAGGTTTYYISNDYEIKNGVETKYIFAGNLRVATIDDNNTYIFHKDHLGSSTAMTTSTAGEIETSEYMPFGCMREHTGTEVSDYKFTDQELDNSSNLYNYDARLYDPVIGRFISSDSVIPNWYSPQSLNRYSYCFNNPLIYHDPNGHAPDPWLENYTPKGFWGALGMTTLNTFYTIGDGILSTPKNLYNQVNDFVHDPLEPTKIPILGPLGKGIGESWGEASLNPSVSTISKATGETLFGIDAALGAAALARSAGLPGTASKNVNVRHYTSEEGKAAINESGALREGTYVTKPGEIPAGSSNVQVEQMLEIDPGKGTTYIDLNVPKSKLKVPANGPETSGNKWQRQLTEPQKIDPDKWRK